MSVCKKQTNKQKLAPANVKYINLLLVGCKI